MKIPVSGNWKNLDLLKVEQCHSAQNSRLVLVEMLFVLSRFHGVVLDKVDKEVRPLCYTVPVA